MWRYLQLHEAFVRKALAGELGALAWNELRSFHEHQIRYMQHERLVHLIVTLFVATFWLLSLGFVSFEQTWAGLAVTMLLLVLLVAYVIHYYRLENGVQRCYHLATRIDEKTGTVSARYESGEIQTHVGA
ncbi:hypothetical protein ACFL6C_02410 [Myxococcota bacterium]